MDHGLLYNTARYAALRGKKQDAYISKQYSIYRKKGKSYLFYFCFVLNMRYYVI